MRRLLAMWWCVGVLASLAAGQATTQPASQAVAPATLSATSASTQAATAPATQGASAQAARRKEQDQFLASLNALNTEADKAAAELSELNNQFVANGITSEIDQESVIWFRQREIDGRIKETDQLLAGVPTLETLRQQHALLDEDLRQLREWTAALDSRRKVLGDGIDKLSLQQKAWHARQADLNRRSAALAIGVSPTTAASQPAQAVGRFTQRIESVLSQTNDLLDRFTWEQERIDYTLLPTISGLEFTVNGSIRAVDDAERKARDRLLVQDSPALWSALLHPVQNGDVAEQGRNSFANQWFGFVNYLSRQTRAVTFHATIVTVLVGLLVWLRRRTRQWVGSDPNLLAATRVFQTPIATAITASMILTPWIYVAAPRLFWGFVGTSALIPTLVVLRPLIARSLRPLLYGLAVAVFVDLLLSIVAALPLVYRAIQLGQMGGLSVFFLWFLRTGHGVPGDPSRPSLPRLATVGAKIGLAITVFAALANVFGYVSLARLIGSALLTSAYLGVLLDTSVHVVDALLLGVSHVQPLSTLGMVHRHRPLLLGRFHLLLVVLAVWLWGYFTLDALTIRKPVFNVATAVWNWPRGTDVTPPAPPAMEAPPTTAPATAPAATTAEKATPDQSPRALLSVGGVVLFVVSILASIYIARFVTFLLDEDIYPRLKLARGMPYAISTLLKYVILAIGFSLAIINLGYGDPTKLTILVSAFSIGLGFGLQNIVNNFVSGLILLFERPVQVGDVIELDNVTGVVSRIGIRASVIRTPLAAEIIVPNGRLISDRVVNWTLSNRQRGVELPLTVAAGTDPQKLIQLLIATAKQLPLVAAYPAPQAYFTDFSGGGMRFELRAWTNRFEDWSTVRSELAVAINAALMKENIQLK